MRKLASPLQFEDRPETITTTLSNPGLLYNIGNACAVFGALAFFVLLSRSDSGVTAGGFVAHFLGKWPTLLTTTASLVFWVSGMKYASAWANGFPPNAKANSMGHALSTCGALTIGVALMGLARTEVALALAIIATILHTGGKLVSWRSPKADDYFKAMPLYSRVPYVTTLCLDIRSDVLTDGRLEVLVTGLILPLSLLVATMFWARADWLLLQRTK